MELRTVAVLACLVLGAAQAGPINYEDNSSCSSSCKAHSNKFKYEVGQTYIYGYQSTSNVAVTDHSGQHLNIRMTAQAEISVLAPCEMVLRLRDVQLTGSGIEDPRAFKQALEAEELPFGFDDGLITGICPLSEDVDDETDDDSVLNIKRAILSAFQNSMHDLESPLSIRETDVAGACLTKYQKASAGWSSVTITKTKDLSSCIQRHDSNIAIFASPYLSDDSPIQNLPLLSGQIECHQTIGTKIVQKVECTEENVFKPFSRHGHGAAINTKISLVFRSTEERVTPRYSQYNRRSNLLFAHTPSKFTKTDETDARQILTQICEKSRDIVRPAVPHLFSQLVSVIRSLPSANVQSLVESVNGNEFCPSARDVVIDALSMTGTEGGVKTMVRLLKNKEISHVRSNIWFTMMAFNTHVTEEAVAAIAPLLNDREIAGRQALLGLSSMVYNYCAKKPDCHQHKAVKDVITVLQRRLQKCRASNIDDENAVIDVLSAFENMGRVGDAKDDILECASTESNSNAVRQAAIRSLRRVPCGEKIKRKMIDMYGNTAEDAEIRIYAYRAAMHCADETIIQQVKTVLEKEPINQVGAYVWTHMTNLQETSIRQKQTIREIVSDVTLSKKFSGMDFRRFSRNVEWSTFLNKINAGLGVEMDLIYSPKSYIPRTLNFNLTSDLFGQSMHLIGLQTHMEGLEHMMETYFGKHGYFSNIDLDKILAKLGIREKDYDDDSENETSRRVVRDAKPSSMNKLALLHERMGVETPRDARVSTSLTLLGRKIARLTLNDIKELFNVEEAIDVMEILAELAQNKKVDRSASAKFMDLEISTASVSGMQINLAINGTATVAIKADGKFDIRKLLTAERSADIDGYIKPSGAIEISALMSVRAGSHKPGLKIVSTGYTSAHIQGKLQMKEGRILKMSIDLPREKIEVLNLRTDVYLVEAGGVQKPIKPPATYDINKCGKALGLALCVKMQAPKPLFSEKTPLIPIGGPMSLEWTLEKVDRSMQGYELSFSLPSEHDYTERVYRFEFDTPGSKINHHYALEGHLNNQQKGETVLNLKLRSPMKSLMGTGSFVARPDLLRGRIALTIDTNRKYAISAEAKIQERGNQVEYTPSLELHLPEIEPITFGGSLVRTTGGRKQQLTIDLKSNKPSSKPIFIRGNVAIEGQSRLSTDVTVSIPKLESRLHGTVDKQDTVFATDMTLEYQAGRQRRHTVKLTSKGQNLSTHHLTKLSVVTELQMSQIPEANLHVAWEMQHKPLEHFENEITLKYGESMRPIHILQVSKLEVAKKRGKSENRLLVEAPEFIKDVELMAITDWDMRDKPSFHLDTDVKYAKVKKVETSLDYKCKRARPLEMEIEVRLKTPEREFIYRDTLHERSPNEFEGHTMFQWKPNKKAVVDYTYRVKSDSSKTHHEVDVRLQCPSFSMPLQHKALLRVTRDTVDVRSHTQHEGKPVYSIDAKLTTTGPSKVEVEVLGWQGEMEIEKSDLSKTARIELRDTKNKHYSASVKYNTDSRGVKHNFDVDVNVENEKPFKLSTALTRISESSSPRYRWEGKAKYGEVVNVKLHSEVSSDVIEGPHDLTIEVDGHRFEPRSLHFSHKIENGALLSVMKLSKNHAEEISAEASGKYQRRSSSQIDLSGSIALKSPHSELNGKQIAFGYKRVGNKHVTDFRLQGSPATPYTLNVEYEGQSSWSKGKHDAKVLLTTPIPEYRSQEGRIIVEYNNNKYELKTDVSLASGKKLHMAVDMDIQPGRITGSYKLKTPFSTLNSLRISTLTEFSDNYRTENAIEVNGDKKFAWKGHFNSKDDSDMDGLVDIQSDIGPKFDVNVRLIRNPQKYNYEVIVKKDAFEVFSTKMLHQKKGREESNGLLQIKKGDTTWDLDWQKELNNDGEITYSVKSRGLGQPMTFSWSHNEKDNELTSEMKVCLTGRDSECLVMEGRYKKEDSAYYGTLLRELAVKISQKPDLQVALKVELNAQKDSLRHKVDLELFGREIGYKVEAKAVNEKSTGLIKIKLPSRVMKAEGSIFSHDDSAEIKLEFLGDAERQPSRKLTMDISAKEVKEGRKHGLRAHLVVNHPEMSSPVKAVLELESDEGQVLRPVTGKMEIEYTNDPSKKVFIVAYVEAPDMDKHNKTIFLNVYQADHKDLDFMWKSHIAVHTDKMTTGYHWHWTSKSQKTEGLSLLEIDHRDKEIHFYYRCPSDTLDVHGKWQYQPNKVLTVDMDAKWNNDPSKIKLVVDIPKPCVEVMFYEDPAGSPSYRLHSCVDSVGKSLLTITSEYFEADQKITDASLVFDRRTDKTFSAHMHWNPERLGVLMYHMMKLGDALEGMEFESKMEKVLERISVLAREIDSEILEPIVKYSSKEISKLMTELAADFRHVRHSLKRAYNKLPEVDIYEPVAKFVSEVNSDISNYVEDVLPESLKEFLHHLVRYVEDASESVCSYGSTCYQFRAAYHKRGLDGIMELLYTAFANMPDSYYRIAVATKDFVQDKLPSLDMEPVWKAAEKAAKKIEDIMEPVMKSEIVKKMKHSMERLSNSLDTLFEDVYEAIWEKVEYTVAEILKMPEARAIYDMIAEFYHEIAREIRKFPLEKTMEKIIDFSEDFLSVDALTNSIHVVTFDEEKGEAQIDIRLPADIKTLRKSFYPHYDEEEDDDDDSDVSDKYNAIQSAVRKEWVPPFKSHAQLVGGQHYMTFDNTFYDFAGECSYLLARDFADGNFTVAVKYQGQRNDGKIDKAIVVVVNDRVIEVDPDEESVTLDEQPVDLPLFVGPVSVFRRGSTFVVDNQHGIQVTCHLVHDYCTTVVSGWYFGKTAGLFGTYDNEPSNDFTRPRGKVSGTSDFAKSWQLNSGCKHKNLAKEINVDPESEQFELCKRYFRDDSSPLQDCFDELNEEEYFKICVRQTAIQLKPEEALCTVAAAFVDSCRQHKLSVSLPSVCLKCKSSSLGDLEYGKNRRYDQFEDVPHSADIVYIIEERECNRPVVKEMDSIARLVDRELINSGFTNNKYAVVAFGGKGGESEPHTHTARGKAFFGVQDVVLATEKINFQNKKTPVDTFGALSYAIRLHYREGVSKTFILMTCAACDEDSMSVDYSDIQRLLLDRGITLHVMNERSIQVRSSYSKGRNIIAVDAQSVYRGKDISQKSLYGQPDLRSQVAVPKDICIALAQEVDGAFFTTKPLTKNSPVESKNWKSLLARRIAKTAVPHSCQFCNCAADHDLDVSSSVCQPCVVPSPKVPITMYTSEDDEYY